MSATDLSPDLLMTNARVVTLAGHSPRANAVAVQGDRIVWVGSDADADAGDLQRPHTTVVDCLGQALLPGFIDAHCHLLAYASSLLAVDCAPSAVDSIEEIKDVIGRRARETPAGRWIRGAGYDELSLLERRHPTRWDLDAAAPDHPVRLNHRSGHACVLNSAALRHVGLSADTPDPVDGVMERVETGEPTGLLLEMDDYLDGRVPVAERGRATAGGRGGQPSFCLRRRDVDSGRDPFQLRGAVAEPEPVERAGEHRPRVTLMAGSRHLKGFREVGMGFGVGDHNMNLGHVKIMLTATTGSLQPSERT